MSGTKATGTRDEKAIPGANIGARWFTSSLFLSIR